MLDLRTPRTRAGMDMVEREATVMAAEGLHARPAAQFVKAAKAYNSDIRVIKGDRDANAKSSLNLMTLGAKQNDTLIIRAEGDDEEEAVDALAALIAEDE